VATATVASLTEKERALIAETERAALLQLDEDGLLELLARVRRARDKFVQLHRREVGSRVVEKGARGAASAPSRRSASKAEIFEDALARVSAAVAKAARTSAAALKAERLAAAAAGTQAAPVSGAGSKASVGPSSTPSAKGRARKPVERKVVASSRAAGAKRQAARDAR